MNSKIGRDRVRGLCWASGLSAALSLLAACGGGPSIEGRYDGVGGDSLLESITLGSDGVASVVYPFGFGNSGQGSYTVENNVVTVIVPSGDRAEFQINENGCLTHFLIGTLCRGASGGGGSSPFGGSPAAVAGGGGAERYEATVAEGTILLELLGGGTARMTMTPFGGGGGDMPQRMSFDLSYETSGDGFVIEMPGEGPTMVTRSGRDLLMTQNGETARFIRQ